MTIIGLLCLRHCSDCYEAFFLKLFFYIIDDTAANNRNTIFNTLVYPFMYVINAGLYKHTLWDSGRGINGEFIYVRVTE